MFILLVVILSLIGVYLYKKPQVKGWLGEFAVKRQFKNTLKKTNQYILINDCTLPTDVGSTTQIDHIILSLYGIFVIETKNYKGRIFGKKYDKLWTQRLNRSYTFQNPLHQNYKHICTLQESLATQFKLPTDCLQSVVVFVGDCTFKTAMPPNICLGNSWVDYVLQFKSPLLTQSDIKKIQTHIEKTRLKPGMITNRLHVQNLKMARRKSVKSV